MRRPLAAPAALLAVLALVWAACAVPAGASSPAAGPAFTPIPAQAARPLSTTYTFGAQPLSDVLASAAAHASDCAGLTTSTLAAMVLAPTYPETGASGSVAPSPMTLSRYDSPSVNSSNVNLYYQGNPATPYQGAFWNPGVGMWQFDSAGGWLLSTADEINSNTAAAEATSVMAGRWCGDTADAANPAARRAKAWSPWGCGSGGSICETVYQGIYNSADPSHLRVTTDAGVTRSGGMITRSCQLDDVVTITCNRVDPSLAQGDAAFADPNFGTTPISAPFYDYVRAGVEHRVWLSSDTGYPVSIEASLTIGSNARSSLTWDTTPQLCDLTTLAGACNWTGWQAFDNVWMSKPSVARNTDGRLEMFAVGWDGVVYHAWQAAPNGSWSGWSALPGLTTARSVVVQPGLHGNLVAVARLSDNTVATAQQSSGAWSSWTNRGGGITSTMSAATNADGRFEVFAIGTNGVAQHLWQTPAGNWSGWHPLSGSNLTALTAVTNASGRLEVFVVAAGTIWHAYQTAPGSPFTGWYLLGGKVAGGVSVGFNPGGRLELFFRGTDSALWHLWQTSPTPGWSAVTSLGGFMSGDPVAGANRDGRLEIFAPGVASVPAHMWQTSPGGRWSAWSTFGGPAAASLGVAAQANGDLVLFERTTGSVIYRNTQLV
jgi:hypothetical protein